MSNIDPVIQTLLDEHVPLRLGERCDWDEVLRRVGSHETRRRRGPTRFAGRRRLLAVVAVALAALLIPIIAIGASEGWWFARTPSAPKPEGAIVIVKTDSWNGVPWALTAYRSAGNVCFGLTPNWQAQDAGSGAGLECGVPLRGLAQESRTYPVLHWAGYLEGGRGGNFPGWIAGPTAPEVAEVDVVSKEGETIRAPTFAAPAQLGLKINFYVAQLPCGEYARALIPKDAEACA